MRRNRFKVIEYSSFFAVKDMETGAEHPMGDGVDTLFTPTGKAMKPGTKGFIRAWERALNERPDETLEAYFPHQCDRETRQIAHYCPDCGSLTLRLIENTEADGCGEYKEVRTCDKCENIVYIVRRNP